MVLELNPVAKKVAELLEPHVERQGFELVAVEYKGGSGRAILRVLIDRPERGITMSDLERLSPVIGDLLDVYDPVEGSYLLEVASPGINRPLAKFEHFQAYRGQRIRVRTHHARDGQKHFVGTLAEVGPAGIAMDDEMSRRRHDFNFNEIKEANYEHRFD